MRMSTKVQIRNVPDAWHRRLKSRAALAGMSLSDYLLRKLRQVAGDRRLKSSEHGCTAVQKQPLQWRRRRRFAPSAIARDRR